jgi:hypothetical protein
MLSSGEAVLLIRNIVAEPGTDGEALIFAAVILSKIAPGLAREAERILESVASDPGNASRVRDDATKILTHPIQSD